MIFRDFTWCVKRFRLRAAEDPKVRLLLPPPTLCYFKVKDAGPHATTTTLPCCCASGRSTEPREAQWAALLLSRSGQGATCCLLQFPPPSLIYPSLYVFLFFFRGWTDPYWGVVNLGFLLRTKKIGFLILILYVFFKLITRLFALAFPILMMICPKSVHL